MKNSTKDYNLLKSFIQSEFFFNNSSRNTKYASNAYFYKNGVLTINDPIIHLKEVKQLIRLLQFLKNNKFPFLQVVVKNPQYDFLIHEFLKLNNKNLCMVQNYLDSDLKKNISFSKVVLLFDCFLRSDSNFFHKSQHSVFNILCKINGLLEKNYFKNYKIHSDFDSIKKLIFLLIIIKHVFIK